MRLIRMLARRLRAILGKATLDAEQSEELSFHYDMAVEDAVNRGIPLDAARRAARREFGAHDGVAEAYRDARGTRLLEGFARDARYAFRSLRSTPTFALTAIGTLALGIGATTAVFSVVNGVLIRPLPYAEPGELVIVWETDRDSGTEREDASVPDFFDYAERVRSLQAISAYSMTSMSVTGAGYAERVQAAKVTGGFFRLLGVEPLAGRLFSGEEDLPGGPAAVLLSERYWRSRFGGRAEAIGSSMRMDDSLYRVVGVMPDDVRLPTEQTDLWIPYRLTPASSPRTLHNVTMLGRLASGTKLPAAQLELAGLAAELERQYPAANNARGIHLESLEAVLLGQVRPALLVVLAAVALVLLIACVNVASLLLSRRAARSAEVALRAALGASRARLAQQFFVESLILTIAAAAIGTVLAFAGVRALVAIAPDGIPRLTSISVEPVMLGFALGLSVIVAMVFGLIPVAGGRHAEPADTLKGATARGGGRSREQRRLRMVLVTSEIALSLVLVVAASLLTRSFARLHAVDPGFDAQHLLSVRYQLPTSRYPQRYEAYPASWSRILEFQRALIGGVSALHGVESAAIGSSDPMDAGFANSFVIIGREAEAQQGQAEIATRSVSAEYFATVGIPLIKGRAFNAGDDASAPPVLIINKAFADKYFRNSDPLGQQIRFWGTTRRVVGVVGNERFNGLGAEAAPAMYPPASQAPVGTASLVVRTAGDPELLVPAVRKVVAGLDDQLAVFRVRTMENAIEHSIARQRFLMQLVGGFAALALLLAVVGVYGMVAYSVAQRKHEFGVRVAVGATSRQVTALMLREGLRLATAGLLLGAAGALGAGRLLSSQLFAVSATDPAAFVAAAAAVLGAVLLASYLPARKAGEVSVPGMGE